MGSYQDAYVVGLNCSHQSWKYKERTNTYLVEDILADPQTGEPIFDENGEQIVNSRKETETEVVKDYPMIEPFPIENVRFDPTAKWWDPVNTSPYLILLWPMYVKDVKARMEASGEKGVSKWVKATDGEIKAATKQRYDSTRQTRSKDKEDSTDNKHSEELGDFDIVWVHENIMEYDSQDVVYWTLGTEHLLTKEPIPIEEEYWTGNRPITIGTCVLEAHNLVPDAAGELGKEVQREINLNVNQRADNVKQVMNKRWLIKRGAQIDLRSINRNVTGGITMVNSNQASDPDVKPEEFHDVTQSAYSEQDRLNLDYDELVGNFSVSTVGTNRQMGETVGGMAMSKGPANTLTEYSIRTFVATWMERTLRQFLQLEEAYETDENILMMAAQKAKLPQLYNVQDIGTVMELMQVPVRLSVNIALGATDPLMRMQHFSVGLDIIMKAIQDPMNKLNDEEVAKEVFGFLGWKDGARFLMDEEESDPEKEQMQMIIEQLQQALEDLQGKLQSKEAEQQVKLMITQIKEQGQDRRKSLDVKAKVGVEKLKLLNPVAGERPPVGMRLLQ
jgi:hypothetical protein